MAKRIPCCSRRRPCACPLSHEHKQYIPHDKSIRFISITTLLRMKVVEWLSFVTLPREVASEEARQQPKQEHGMSFEVLQSNDKVASE